MKKNLSILTVSIIPFLGNAQTATIYRAGLPLTPTYSTIAAALPNIVNGDELRLSAHTFNEYSLSSNKYFTLKGTISGTDSTTIDAKGLGQILFLNYDAVAYLSDSTVFDNIIFQNGKVTGTGIPFRGAGGIASEGSHIIITGNTIFRNNSSTYSSGALSFTGKVEVKGGEATGSSVVKFYNNTGSITGGGGAIFGTGTIVNLTGNIIISNNTGNKGAGLWLDRAPNYLSIIDSKGGKIQIINNTALTEGGALYLNNVSSIPPLNQGTIIKGNVEINNNTATTNGGGIWSNDSLRIEGLNVQIKNNSAGNMGGGIYNKSHGPSTPSHGTLFIAGTEFNGNKAAVGAGLYNDYYTNTTIQNCQFINNQASGTNAASAIQNNNKLSITNCRIYNPTTTAARQLEVQNNFVLNSSQCWWGESDTTGLIKHNSMSVGSSFTLTNWVKANWSVNNGSPIGAATSYPISATFTLNTGTALPASSFAMLQGKFTAPSGSFSPAIANNTAANKITSTYTRPSSGTSILWAVVDADSFKSNSDGLSVKKLYNAQKTLRLFPNPTKGIINIEGISQSSAAKLINLHGMLIQEWAVNPTNTSIDLSGIATGMYILQIINNTGQMEQYKVIKD
jgi:predicted outer membrane repeat protein